MKSVLLKYTPFSILLICSLYLVYQNSNIEIPIDVGDGMQHYYLAAYAFENPLLLLDHWGKPIFTLLMSPFAQFGINAVIFANILIFILTSLVGLSLFKKAGVHPFLWTLLPVTLLYSTDYVQNILSGLSEVLAGFLVVQATYFLYQKKWIAMAIVISMLPFARSEGQLMVILGALVLLYNKQYKYIPFLASVWLIYAIIGFFALGDFWWYFSQDPYPSNSIYGSGTWSHFWDLKEQYMGVFGLIILWFGLLTLAWLIIKKKSNSLRWDMLFFTFGTFFGIVIVHTYLWANGIKGSLGLTRVATIGLPGLIVAIIYILNEVKYKYINLKLIVAFAFCFLAFQLRDSIYTLPEENPLSKSIIEAGKYIKANKPENSRVYYYHPLISFSVGINPYNTEDSIYVRNTFFENKERLLSLDNGDLVVRESHFGPKEMGLSLKLLEEQEDFVLVQEFIPESSGSSYHSEPWSVSIYQRIPIEDQIKMNPYSVKTIISTDTSIFLNEVDEYIGILGEDLTDDYNQLRTLIDVEKDGGILVCDINEGEKWMGEHLRKAKNREIILPVKKNDKIKLYFWNPDKITNTVKIKNLEYYKSNFHPITKKHYAH
ncbi:MAG: hypothetical protein WC994_07965 [Brumimicrobium sp.]